MNYYSFISGSPDIELENSKNLPSMVELLEELDDILSDKDKQLLALLRMNYDNSNLMAIMKDKSSVMNPLGNLDRNDWDELIDIMENGTDFSEKHEPRLKKYIAEYYHTVSNNNNGTNNNTELLSSLYYDYGMKCKNKFLSSWFEYNMNLNNILTAIICKKHDWDIKNSIVGNNEIAITIRKNSNSRDFGLKGLYDDFEIIASVAETSDLLEREKKIDALRWNWIDEHTFFNYFSIEKVLAFWLKCEILHRWDELNQESGAKIFREILNELKKDVKFE